MMSSDIGQLALSTRALEFWRLSRGFVNDFLEYVNPEIISLSGFSSFVSHDWMRFELGLTKAKASFPEFLGNHVSAGESELCQSAMG